MQVTKGTWRMREQCVPGSLPSSPAQEAGSEATEGNQALFPPPQHKKLGVRLQKGTIKQPSVILLINNVDPSHKHFNS